MSATEDFKTLSKLFEYQHNFFSSKIMFTACELGVFDLLLESGELLPSTAIAERLGTSLNGVERLLDACVALKLLRVERKNGKAFYGNTDLSSFYLAKSSPKSQYNFTILLSKIMCADMNYLEDAVREGKNQVDKILHYPSKDTYEAFYSSEDMTKNFLSAMNDVWSIRGQDVLSAFDLSPFPIIYDLGGGGGGLAKECVSLYPNSTVTIFDLPKVVETTKKHFVSEEKPLITFHKGDFFEDPIPEADLYIMARILHNWDDEKCVQLLTKVYKACKSGGGVLIVEMVLDEDRSGPLHAHIYSIIMLLKTEGKTRTLSEFSDLLSAAGFKDIEQRKVRYHDAILGRK